jgi:ribokinase
MGERPIRPASCEGTPGSDYPSNDRLSRVRAAVVGHVEWIEFGRVDHVPVPGEIVHVSDSWQEPAGGGAVAAVQLCKLAGAATLYTALGDDEVGRRTKHGLESLGLRVEADFHPVPQRHGYVHIDRAGERTITLIGDRLGPSGQDRLAWDELHTTDAVYFTAGDAGALHAARRAGTLVSTVRGLETLSAAGVQLDALVASARDPGERYAHGDLDPPPRHVVRTEGADGGSYEIQGGSGGRWDATPLPGPVRDSYGAGDSFAAGLTYGLGAGMPIAEAVVLAARCGAASLTGNGPYQGQLREQG